MRNLRHLNTLATASIAAAGAALTACGGSGSGSDPSLVTAEANVAQPLTLTGSALTGSSAAVSAVEARCNGGQGSTSSVSSGDGSYRIELAAGALPCALRLIAADGAALHSVAFGDASSARANISPVTELVLARAAGGPPASVFSAAVAPLTLKASDVQAATTAVTDMLTAAGVTLPAGVDPLAGALAVPAGASGSLLDAALSALQSQLAATNTRFADLVTSVSRQSPEVLATSLSATASVPADLLLRPAAPNCGALHSGRYRLVAHADDAATVSSGQPYATEVISFDAANLKVTNADGGVESLTPAGDCRYTLPQGGGATASAAGVLLAQIGAAPYRGAVLFPEQTHAVAELAGEWNSVALDRTETNGPVHLTSSTLVLDANGKLLSGQFCDALTTGCETLSGADLPDLRIKLNSAGGFDLVNATDAFTDRLFAYRAGGGELMLVSLSSAGHVAYYTRKLARVLPALGDVSQGWQIGVVGNAQAPFYTAPATISRYQSTVSSLDAAASSYMRQNVQDFTNTVTRPETIVLNSPRDGYLTRQAATVTASNGNPSNVGAWTGLALRGMGLTAVAIAQTNTLFMSVTQAK